MKSWADCESIETIVNSHAEVASDGVFLSAEDLARMVDELKEREEAIIRDLKG